MSDVDDADEDEPQSRRELIYGYCGCGKDTKPHTNIDRRVPDPCRVEGGGQGLMTHIWYIYCSVRT